MSAATATLQFRLARRIGRGLIDWAFRREVEGLENLPAGNVIVACNHLGRMDPFLILATFPPHPRVYFLAAWETSQDSAWKKFMGTVLGGVIPIRRGQGSLDETAITAVHRVLSGGGSLALFPEGSYGTREGELTGPLREGVTHFGYRSGLPVVPVGINGTSHLYWNRRLSVRIGPPIHLPQCDDPTEEEVEAATKQVAAALRALIRPGDPPPERPAGTFLNRVLGGRGVWGASPDSPGGEALASRPGPPPGDTP